MSQTRKRYMIKLFGRCAVFLACLVCCFLKPDVFMVLEKGHFLSSFSPLHLLWFAWVTDMVLQLIPVRGLIPLGSQKLFSCRFLPSSAKVTAESLRSHAVSAAKAAYKVFALWWALIAVIGIAYYKGIFGKIGLFMISVLFYVCDLICVLIWCPFRVMMGNRCCTTCRIFNWDHLMMFSPLLFVGGFFAVSLVVLAVADWALWEYAALRHPERFWEKTNTELRCSSCTDKLCTQYCRRKNKASCK